MNLKFLSAVVAFSLGCSALGSAQKPNKISLREGEAKVRKILAERAAKEGKTAHAALTASAIQAACTAEMRGLPRPGIPSFRK